jgi:hypothetical protein
LISILIPRLPNTIIPRCYDAVVVAKSEYPDSRILWQEGTLLPTLRNQLVTQALGHEDSEWMLFLDSDMLFPSNFIQLMLDKAKRNNIKFLTGTYFCKDYNNINPVISKYVGILEGSPSFLPLLDEVMDFLDKYAASAVSEETAYLDAPDSESLIKIGGCGAGCMLVHREVLEKMGPPWFSFERGCSEDYFFSLKAQEAGYDIYADLSVQCGHITLASISYKTFHSRYPKGQATFRANIGNSHIAAASKYFSIDNLEVVDRIKNAAFKKNISNDEPNYIYHLISWNVSPIFATIINNTARIVFANPGKALVFGGGIGTEAAFLAQNGWEVINYEPSALLRDYSKTFIDILDLNSKVITTDTLEGKFDFIFILDVLDNIPEVDLSPTFSNLLTNHLNPGGYVALYNPPTSYRNSIIYPILYKTNHLVQRNSIVYRFYPQDML